MTGNSGAEQPHGEGGEQDGDRQAAAAQIDDEAGELEAKAGEIDDRHDDAGGGAGRGDADAAPAAFDQRVDHAARSLRSGVVPAASDPSNRSAMLTRPAGNEAEKTATDSRSPSDRQRQ